MSGSYLMYIVAGRDLASRESTHDADDLTAEVIRRLYAMWENEPRK